MKGKFNTMVAVGALVLINECPELTGDIFTHEFYITMLARIFILGLAWVLLCHSGLLK